MNENTEKITINVEKRSRTNGEVYTREIIFDKYGRKIGNNDYTNHGWPDIPGYIIPHYHQNSVDNLPQHGLAVPGLHPDIP